MVILLSFTSCGSDDDDPDYTLYDKSEIVGDQAGTVSITLSPGNYPAYGSSTTSEFYAHPDSKKLNLALKKEIGGPIEASNFRRTAANDKYLFNLASWTTDKVFIGNEIPEYMTEWFSNYTLTKVVIKNLTCSGGGEYVKQTKAMSFTYTGKLYIYVEGSNESMNLGTINFAYTNLKKLQ